MFKKIQRIAIISVFLVITVTCILAQSAKEWHQKGIELYKQGKYEEAAKWFDKALAISPEYMRAKKGKEEALKALEK